MKAMFTTALALAAVLGLSACDTFRGPEDNVTAATPVEDGSLPIEGLEDTHGSEAQ